MTPVIAFAGLGLFKRGFPGVDKCVEIGVPMLIIFVGFSQYLNHIHSKDLPIFEHFPVLIFITLAWVYAHPLTASGAYKHVPERTKINCRTDRAHLISSAPWYVVL